MTAIILPTPVRETVAQLLHDSAQGQGEVSQLTKQQKILFHTLLQESQARLLRTVDACLVQTENRAEVFALARKTPLSPFLKPLPAPPVDDEVHALESQVAAACQRVAEMRATVPKRLAQQLSQQLQQCRPYDTAVIQTMMTADDAQASVELIDSQKLAVQQDAAFTASLLKPAPAELQEMYSAAVQKMPALRAKLGEALERMDRVVHAIEQDTAQPSLFTVQLPTHLQQADTDSVSPALQQALQIGQVTTRKGMAKDVQPVPFAI